MVGCYQRVTVLRFSVRALALRLAIAWRLTTPNCLKSCRFGKRCLTLDLRGFLRYHHLAAVFVAWVATRLLCLSSAVRTCCSACWLAPMAIPPVLSLIRTSWSLKFLGLLDNTWRYGYRSPPHHLVSSWCVSTWLHRFQRATWSGEIGWIAGEFRTYWSVVLPLMKPALATWLSFSSFSSGTCSCSLSWC